MKINYSPMVLLVFASNISESGVDDVSIPIASSAYSMEYHRGDGENQWRSVVYYADIKYPAQSVIYFYTYWAQEKGYVLVKELSFKSWDDIPTKNLIQYSTIDRWTASWWSAERELLTSLALFYPYDPLAEEPNKSLLEVRYKL